VALSNSAFVIRKHGFLLAILIATLILITASASLLYASYRDADIAEFSSFVTQAAGSDRECSNPRVVAALLSATGNSRYGVSPVRANMLSWFAWTRDKAHTSVHDRSLMIKAQRALWARILFSDEQVLGAHCALGSAGPHYTLPRIAKIVGVQNLLTASEDELRALADVYVLDLRVYRNAAEIRDLYRARLQRNLHSRRI